MAFKESLKNISGLIGHFAAGVGVAYVGLNVYDYFRLVQAYDLTVSEHQRVVNKFLGLMQVNDAFTDPVAYEENQRVLYQEAVRVDNTSTNEYMNFMDKADHTSWFVRNVCTKRLDTIEKLHDVCIGLSDRIRKPMNQQKSFTAHVGDNSDVITVHPRNDQLKLELMYEFNTGQDVSSELINVFTLNNVELNIPPTHPIKYSTPNERGVYHAFCNSFIHTMARRVYNKDTIEKFPNKIYNVSLKDDPQVTMFFKTYKPLNNTDKTNYERLQQYVSKNEFSFTLWDELSNP
jgi:hypothetical protein